MHRLDFLQKSPSRKELSFKKGQNKDSIWVHLNFETNQKSHAFW